MYHLILERLSRRTLQRVPEPELIMLDPLQNTAFWEAGSEDGFLAFTYFYHALQSTPVVLPGDRVLDIACGPANQLAQIARLNPLAHFIGLDASGNMLDRARATLARLGINNVELVAGDMTRLDGIGDASIDCVICTMSLHHLPDVAALASTMRQIRRVLKPGGGLYLVDFGRLKRAATQHFFSEDQRDLSSPEFTQDYLNSMRAAFGADELADAAAVLGPDVEYLLTPLATFMVVVKSAARRKLDETTRKEAGEMYRQLSPAQKKKFQALALWFRVGGFDLPCALD